MGQFRLFLIILLNLAVFETFAQPYFTSGILRQVQANMNILHYRVAVDIDPASRMVTGNTQVTMNLLEPSSDIILDLVKEFSISKLMVNHRVQAYTHTGNQISIKLVNPMSGRIVVDVEYSGKPPEAARPPWLGGFQWATDSLGNPWISVMCQNEGAKIYFPCKDHPSDEPDEGAELNVTVPKGLLVAGPGILTRVADSAMKSTFYWKTTYPINNYGIVFNVGKYEVLKKTFKTIAGNQVPMEFYVLQQNASKGKKHLDMLAEMVSFQEKYFGEYPWVKEKIGIAETPHLGMEHQTMNAYGNKFKYTTLGGKPHDWLMLHELGHEWWGNKVTGKDWGDMWIQEGICSFADALYTRDMEGEEAYLLRMKQTLANIKNEKPVVQGTNINSNDAYHGDIYGKGAFFMHTLRYVLTDSIFFPTLKQLATQSRYNMVNTDEVEQLFSKSAGVNVKPLFDLFLRTTNKLEIAVKKESGNQYSVRLLNFNSPLPLDIDTGKGLRRMMVGSSPVMIESSALPVIDPKEYFLKKVITE